MKILLYDPLYSRIGHFYRYNVFLVELLNSLDFITGITVIAEQEELKKLDKFEKVTVIYNETRTHSMQEKSMKVKGISKVSLLLESYRNYRKVITKINASDCDLVFFSSNGQLSFWLSCFFLKKRYAVSAISIKWFYRNGLKDYPMFYIYRRFLAKSSITFFTEEMYSSLARKLGINNTSVFPDRFLQNDKNIKVKIRQNVLQLITVGTISSLKNPLSFISDWNQAKKETIEKFRYDIYGKVMDDNLQQLDDVVKKAYNITFVNDYISGSQYDELMKEADFVVIPYPEEYTRYATSGVMWDCFQMHKPILCPDIEPFRYYINKYGVGYLYSDGKLEKTLEKIHAESEQFAKTLGSRFKSLTNENSFERLQMRLQRDLQSFQNAVI